MLSRKYIKYPVILAFILLSALRGNIYAVVCPSAASEKNEVFKAEILLESKGIIQSAPQISNGGAFQHTLYKLKNPFGSNSSFSVKPKAAGFYTQQTCTYFSGPEGLPLYLFNRSIRL